MLVEPERVKRGIIGTGRFISRSRSRQFYFGVILLIVFLGLVGPYIAPQDPGEYNFTDEGDLRLAEPPSLDHPLGTNSNGQDVFSRLLVGTQPTAITGLLGGLILVTLGSTVGITAGYVGGRVDSVLMRFTDIVYGIPLLPFAVVLIAFFGIGFIQTIVVIGLVLWRDSARVLRSQVLQIKEREYVLAVKAEGASTPHIIVNHIIPNILPMMAFFFAVGMGATILIQAGLAFIGVSDPFVPSWGIMIRNAFFNGYVSAWWWSVPPGLLIGVVVYSAIMLGRSIEQGQQGSEENLASVGA